MLFYLSDRPDINSQQAEFIQDEARKRSGGAFLERLCPGLIFIHIFNKNLYLNIIIKETQVKITMRYQLISNRMATIKTKENKSWQEKGEQ